MDLYEKLYLSHNTNNNKLQPIQVITGDFNCADFKELHNFPNNKLKEEQLSITIESINNLNDLHDIDFSLRRPTFKHKNGSGEKRIDRFYIDKKLINPSQNNLSIMQSTISDHYILSTNITINNQTQQPKKPRWRLNPQVAKSLKVINSLNKILKSITSSDNFDNFKFSDLEILMSKIKKFYNYHQREFLNQSKVQIDNLKKMMQHPEFANQAEATLHALIETKKLENKLQNELNKHINSEIPSRYLSAILHKRTKEVQIQSIKNSHGDIIDNPKLIEDEFLDYFTQLYSKRTDDPSLHSNLLSNWNINTDHTWNSIGNPFTEEEICEAISNSNPHKSPGPDGITNLPFIIHMKYFSKILQMAFNDALKNPSTISNDFKCGLVITLPKKGDPLLIKNRRPITLTNSIYKLFAKVINKRLIRILPKIINNTQKGFVPRRFIIDNIISMENIISYNNSKNLPGIITMYDFEKAFDSISHDSIQRTLNHIQIPQSLINLIMNLLSGSSAKIDINGNQTSPFQIERGVKQGDPLSPTLFVMVIECLAQTIIKDSNIIGLSICNDPSKKEKFQSFADDSASFSSNINDLNITLKHFDTFCKSTSSKVNIDKSISIVLGNQQPLHIPIPIANSPQRYLGYYFNSDGLVKRSPDILKCIRSSLVLWKSLGTTIKTKINILKSFTLSKLNYYQYLEEFSKDEMDQINRLIIWFLSAPNNKSPNEFTPMIRKIIPLMKKQRSHFPMEKGGWNLWDIEKRQRAQKIWIINRFIWLNQNNNINSSYQYSWKHQLTTNKFSSKSFQKFLHYWSDFKNRPSNHLTPILNKDSKPIELKEIYYQLLNLPDKIPKTDFQETLSIRGYSYNKLFSNILKLKDIKGRNTMFKFHTRCLPINFLHNKPCPMCFTPLINDPYGHLLLDCEKTRKYINIEELKEFIYNVTGKNSNWEYDQINNTLIYKPKKNENPDLFYNSEYNYRIFPQDEPFNWNYRDINYDLDRHHSVRNLLSLILHQIWIWLCNQLFNKNIIPQHQTQQLNYDTILNKWHKLASIEYAKTISELRINSIKLNKPIKPNTITTKKTLLSKFYCIPLEFFSNSTTIYL